MAIGWIVFSLVFGTALLAMLVHNVLPEHHLSSDSKDVVKLGIALIATMSALVLSLLVASAKSGKTANRYPCCKIALPHGRLLLPVSGRHVIGAATDKLTFPTVAWIRVGVHGTQLGFRSCRSRSQR